MVLRGLLLGLSAGVLTAACTGGERPALSADTLAPRACSADGMVVESVSAEGIPPEVATTRQAIIEAARDCDYPALEALAAAGGLVTVIDGAEVPVGEWAEREAAGTPVLRPVAGVLSLTPAAPAGDGSVTWPSAVDWRFSDVAPPEERAALVAVVGEDGVYGWSETGAYAGWRTTIGAAGGWATVTSGPAPG